MDKYRCMIGLDIGTSAIKGVLMAKDGNILAKAKESTKYVNGDEGSVEFDADQLFEKVKTVIASLAASNSDRYPIAGICISSASGNTVVVNSDGKAARPGISWLDMRAKDEVKKVFPNLDELQIYHIVGWPFLNIFPLAHLSWLRCHEPAVLDHAQKIVMSADYINYKLTGQWAIDRSTATTFYLQDQVKGEWHHPFLKNLDIKSEKLPCISSSASTAGFLTPETAEVTGLPAGIPVVLGSFDHPSAARGTHVLEEGTMLLSCGTSWVGFYPIRDRQNAIEQNMLTDPFLFPDGPWGAMFSLPAIARNIDKYLNLYISDEPNKYKLFDRLAAECPAGASGLLINPMKDPETYREQLNLMHDKKEIARALMEGTSYLLKQKMQLLSKAGISARKVVMVGGPSETWPWPQIVSDVLQVPIEIVNGECAGAVGAAIMAGIGSGIYENETDAWRNLNFTSKVLFPGKQEKELYEKGYERFVWYPF